MAVVESDIIGAHKHSSRNRDEVLGSILCGCFYCLATFPPSGIKNWVDESTTGDGISPLGETALCPSCGIDSVVGSGSGFSITRELLSRMKQHWF